MTNFITECKRRYQLARLQHRIERLTRRLIGQASRSTSPIPYKELRELEAMRVDLIQQRNALRTEDELRRIERERGLA